MANTYSRPGVFVNEQPANATPTVGSQGTVAGFYGIAQRGAVGVPLVCNSWQDFVNKFAYGLSSPYYASAYSAYSVFGFFNNGGQALYFDRVAASSAVAASTTFTDGTNTVLTFTASAILDDGITTANDPGTWGNEISVTLTANAQTAANMDVAISYNGTQVESFKNCSMTSTDTNFIQNVINAVSRYVSVVRAGTTAVQAAQLSVAKSLAGGIDGLPAASDFTSALPNMDSVQQYVNLLVCVENQTASFVEAAYAKAEAYNAFFITDGALTDTPTTVQTTRTSFNSEYAALYFPWIQVADPLSQNKSQPYKYIPSAGHIAGMIADTDVKRGTFKAPAGTVDGNLVGVVGVKYSVLPADEDALNSNQINVIKAIPNAGVCAWGARTLASDSDFLYIPVRRELSKIERDLKKAGQWAVFEPNTDTTWRKLKTQARAYLFSEMEAGAFAGTKPDGSDSFFVTCDNTVNTTATINQGQINVQIGVAQVKPGEFVVLNIGQVQNGF